MQLSLSGSSQAAAPMHLDIYHDEQLRQINTHCLQAQAYHTH
jgi:hypothetical protein